MASFGVDALVVNTVRRGPGQMTGMGDNVLTSLADTLTGGAVTATEDQLNRLELMLKISIGASIVSGLFALSALFKKG